MITSAFMGEIRLYAGLTTPEGWRTCDGSLLLVDENIDLYTLIQTTYGGDDTHFALPDLRGRVPVQWSPSIGLGQPGGAERVTILPGQMPVHTHTLSVQSIEATDPDPTGRQPATPVDAARLYHSDPPDRALSANTLPAVGGGQPHENMPPYVVLGQYIICVDGMMPSRPEEAS